MLGTNRLCQTTALALGIMLCLSGCQHVKGFLAGRREASNGSEQLASSNGRGSPADSTARHLDEKIARARSLEKDGQIEQAIGD